MDDENFLGLLMDRASREARTHRVGHLDSEYITWGTDALVQAALLKDIRDLLQELVEQGRNA